MFGVASSFPLTPKQQALLCAEPFRIDVADCKTQDQCPYQAQYNLPISVHDILRANVCSLYSPSFDICEGYIGVLETLDAEFRFGGIASEGLVAKNLEEMYESALLGRDRGQRSSTVSGNCYSVATAFHSHAAHVPRLRDL